MASVPTAICPGPSMAGKWLWVSQLPLFPSGFEVCWDELCSVCLVTQLPWLYLFPFFLLTKLILLRLKAPSPWPGMCHLSRVFRVTTTKIPATLGKPLGRSFCIAAPPSGSPRIPS